MQDWGGDVSLSKFMRLPVSAYYELDKAMIRPLPGNHFALVVPRVHVSACLMASLWLASPRLTLSAPMQLFNIWLEPLVETAVDAQPDEITIRASLLAAAAAALSVPLQLIDLLPCRP